jgi:hypothetical protein
MAFLAWEQVRTENAAVVCGCGRGAFAIPPGADHYAVKGRVTLANDAMQLSFFPHMHLRGKGFAYNLIDGDKQEPLLKLSRYDFNWQLTYKREIPLEWKAGQKLEVVGIFDNSANHPWNPDPEAMVRWGEQCWEEMAYGFFDVAFDARHDRRSWFMRKPLPARPED